MTDSELLIYALTRSELFCGLDIGKGWFIKEFSRGSKISENQNGADCVGLILRGSAEVSPSEQSAVSRLICGNEFGICNIFVREEMPTVLTAKTNCKAAFIPKDDFAARLSSDSVLMYRYIRLCNEKMLYLAEKLRLMSIVSCEDRLMYWLKKNAYGSTVSIELSKDELARTLGMSRASLFRSISKLESGGIIKTCGSIISLINENADYSDNSDNYTKQSKA